MNLKCVFHVTPTSMAGTGAAEPKAVRPRMPTILDLEVDWIEPSEPRGTAHETWQRARGWSSDEET